MKNENLNTEQANDLYNVLCKVYLFMVETEKRIIQVVSKNEKLTDIELEKVSNEYGKILGVYDVVGSKEAVLLNFA